MSNNIYDILNKLPKDNPVSAMAAEPIYESVDPRGDIMEAVNTLEAKFSKFKPDDGDESKYLNPQAKRFVQLAKAKFPETSSDLEAVVAAIGDKTEELDKRDQETAEWMNKAKTTIGQQQREIEQTEQAVNDANARYDAQEKRFQDFNRQVASAELDVKQQAQAALDYAKQPQAQPADIINKVQSQQPQVAPEEPEAEPAQPTNIIQFPGQQTAVPAQADQGQSTQTTGQGQQGKGTVKRKSKGTGKPAAGSAGSQPSAKILKFPDLNPGNLDTGLGSQDSEEVAEPQRAQMQEAVQMQYPEGSPALGQFNFDKIRKAYLAKLPGVDIIFGDRAEKLTDADLYGIVCWFYLKGKGNFDIYTNLAAKNLSTQDAFKRLLKTDAVNHYRSMWDSVKRSEIQKKSATTKAAPLDFNKPKAPETQQQQPAATNKPVAQPKKGQLNLFYENHAMKNLEQLEEALAKKFMNFTEDAKPDFLDLDKDGDTDEPMKSAAKDAKKHEPADVDKDAVAKRKRLQALKDKQEDERAEKGDDYKSASRFVKGRAYGGSAQKDDEDKDELDEASKPDFLDVDKDGDKKEPFKKAVKDAKKIDEKAVSKAQQKFMGMVHAVQKGKMKAPSKDVAKTAKGMTKKAAKDFAATKHKGLPQHVAESRNAESSDYTYETIGRTLCDEQPGLNTNSEAFVNAVYDELIEMNLTPKAARWLVHYDEDFLSDCATSYSHFCTSKEKEMSECGAPMNSFVSEEPLLDAVQELDEIAKLAGLPTKTCESCNCDPCKCNEGLEAMAPSDSSSPLTHCSTCNESPCSCNESMMDESAINEAATRKDFRAVADLLKEIPDSAKRTELAMHHADIFKEQNPRFKREMFLAAAGVDTTPIEKDEEVVVDEAEMGEGNEFSGALAAAKATGAKEFEVDGKKYTVKEDINVNVSANGEEDVVNLIRKLSGMPVVAIQAQPAMAEEVVAEEGPKERDVEYTNTPREEVAGTNAAIPSGTDLNRAKKAYSDKPYRGDNPMAVKEAIQDMLWEKYETMINDVKA
jgi:hypothetical protein